MGCFTDTTTAHYRAKRGGRTRLLETVPHRETKFGTTMRARVPNPSHPAVDWQHQESRGGIWLVEIACPICGEVRLQPSRSVRYRVMRNRFSGLCRADWLRQQHAAQAFKPLRATPAHFAVNWDEQARVLNQIKVQVTCPVCQVPRFLSARLVRHRVLHSTFSGRCVQHRMTATGAVPAAGS